MTSAIVHSDCQSWTQHAKHYTLRIVMANHFTIFALSDATGELSHNLASSAVNQFPDHDCHIVRVPKIKDANKISDYVLKAKECHGVIIFTFVSTQMRQEILKLSKEHQVVAIDVMGPTLDSLANYFHTLPSSEPGLQYKMTSHYFKRTEAVEFTVKHDDGLGLDTIGTAEIVLLGISRTSKTPLSIYLAYHGFRCANIPVIKDLPVAPAVLAVDRSKYVALTVDANKLATIRAMRLRKLGRPESEVYASIDHIREEIDYALRLFRALGAPVIDVTGKAIEETASEVLNLLKL